MNRSDRATIAPASTASPRVAKRVGAVVNARTPAMASGISTRKPASAAEGKGTFTSWNTSYQDQIASPMHQLDAPAPSSANAERVRPLDRREATARLTAAMPEETPSPMSSIAMVVLSPPNRKICQTRKAAHTIATRADARAKRLHSGVSARRHQDWTSEAGAEPRGAGVRGAGPG